MQQSNFIFGILLVAYIVFITVRGELGAYLALLKGAGTPAPTAGNTTQGTLSGSVLSGGSSLLGNAFNYLTNGGVASGANAATSNNFYQNANTFAPGTTLESVTGVSSGDEFLDAGF